MRLFLILLLGCATQGGGGGPDPGPDPDPDLDPDPDPDPTSTCPDFDARFEQVRGRFADALAANSVPGGAIAVVCGGAVRSAGVGVLRLGGEEAVTSSTRFEIGSISKTITSYAAISLVDDGAIDLHAPVTDMLPQLGFGEVTLHHLLSHSSGLSTVPTHWEHVELRDVVIDNADLSRWTPPATIFNYNNFGYAIAGALLEESAGQPFAELVEERVFTPLGMGGATMATADLAANAAHGHWGNVSNPTIDPPSSYIDPVLAPMGGIWASVDDLARLATAPALGRQMEHVTRTGEYPNQFYGYGLMLDDGISPPIASHGGSIEGFLSDMLIVPGAGVAAIALTNSDWYYPGESTLDAIATFVDITIPNLPPTPANERLVGVYASDVFGELEVRAEGSGLVVDFRAHGYTAPLTPYYYTNYEVEWRPESTNIPVTFWLENETDPASPLVSRWCVGTRI